VGGAEQITQWAVLPRLALMRAGDEWGWEPTDFVTKLEQTDDLSIAFTLRPGHMWSDGFGELTSEDVKYSIERLKDSEWSGKWESISHVEVIDKYNGIIKMAFPFAPVWLVALASVGAITNKEATEAVGGQFTTEIPAQLGPYQVKWTPNERLFYSRNPNWIGTPPDWANVDYVLVEDDNSAELAYEAGEVDISEVTTTTAERWKDNLPANSVMKAVGGLRYTWMGMNTEHPLLQDIRVRKAIQRAVDVEPILQAAYSGLAPRSYGIVPPGLIGKRNQSNYSYDPDAARALLDEAGVSGLKLTLQVLNQQKNVTAAQIIQQQLGEVGIEVEVIPLDGGPFWELGQQAKGDAYKDLQLWIMRYGGSPDPFDHFQWFVKDQVGVWNWERWVIPEFDELYQQGIEESNIAKRNEIYLRMGDIMEDTGAYVWITHEPPIAIWRDFVGNVVNPRGVYDFTQMTYEG
ncbi:MAG: ABC transporter substrate-binding protein, partial [Alphaproteobacteria bacterium]